MIFRRYFTKMNVISYGNHDPANSYDCLRERKSFARPLRPSPACSRLQEGGQARCPGLEMILEGREDWNANIMKKRSVLHVHQHYDGKQIHVSQTCLQSMIYFPSLDARSASGSTHHSFKRSFLDHLNLWAKNKFA